MPVILLNISAPCVPNEHWAAPRTDKCARERTRVLSATPGQSQEQLFMVFISLHICLHDISLYMCMCQSTVLHPLLELIPQLARRRSRRMKLNVCILHAYLHSDYISTVSMITKTCKTCFSPINIWFWVSSKKPNIYSKVRV